MEVVNFWDGLYNIFNLVETEKEEWKWTGFIGLVGVHQDRKSLYGSVQRRNRKNTQRALEQARDLCCSIIVLIAFVCGRSSSL